MDTNHVRLQGNLGDDPKFFSAADGKEAFACFRMATNIKLKGKPNAEPTTDTQWHDIVCYGFRADIARTFKKGERVDVTGYKRLREYSTGTGKGTAHEVVAQDLHAVVVIPRTTPEAAPAPQVTPTIAQREYC